MSNIGKSAAEMMEGINAKPSEKELREAEEREAEAERAQLKVGSVWQENYTKRLARIRATSHGSDSDIILVRYFDGHHDIGVRRDRFGGSGSYNFSFVREK